MIEVENNRVLNCKIMCHFLQMLTMVGAGRHRITALAATKLFGSGHRSTGWDNKTKQQQKRHAKSKRLNLYPQ
jgi:hypothetical protein